MNLETIQHELEALFASKHRFVHDGRRVIFWYDTNAEFTEVWHSLEIAGVQKLMHDGAWFRLKYDLLVSHAQDHVLVYLPFPEPSVQDNRLYDVEVTGLRFSADRAGMVWQALGLHDKSLEGFLRDHSRFLAAQSRVEALQELHVPSGADASVLRAAMLCVIARVRTLDAALFVREVLKAGTVETGNRVWLEAQKFFSDAELWDAVFDATGFRSPTRERSTLARLFNALAVTHMRRRWTFNFPKSLDHFVIHSDALAVSLVETWLRDSKDRPVWQTLAGRTQEDLNLGVLAREAGVNAIREADTFAVLEQTVVRECAEMLSKPGEAASGEVLEWIAVRGESHWFEAYNTFYVALEAAAKLLAFTPKWSAGLPLDALALWAFYKNDLYAVDRAYREFCAAFQALETNAVDLLKNLSAKLEEVYVEDYLEHLGEAWSNALLTTGSPVFPPAGIAQQNRFFLETVYPELESARVVVVISDALRYEIAVALQERLAAEDQLDLHLDARITGLPSVTSVGMAALLPGARIEQQGDSIVRDGQASNTTEARQRMLETVVPGARAIQEEILTGQKREEAREWLRKANLVYVYHNVIDTTGESAAQELDVPVASERALLELTNLVKRLTKHLNVSRVFVTADHGFLFQRRALEDYEKLNADKSGQVVSLSKRYMTGQGLVVPDGAMRFDSSIEGFEVVVPRGSLRFISPGRGAQYVHGGASLQEVMVPVLSVKPNREKSANVQKVNVAIQHSGARRITGSPFTLTLIQVEPVAGNLKARDVRVAWYDPSGVPITSELQLRLDSSATSPSERTRRELVQVTLRDPDRLTDYELVIRDMDDGNDLLRETWRIDLAIPDDFGI